jgi:tRNA pseudouridine55 synthase
MEKSILSGFLLLNKPVGPSSCDCIRIIKNLFPVKAKIGHAGTLDSFASGLLIICIGKPATKLSSQLMNQSKEYIAKAKLGELTDTLDHTGTIISQTSNDLIKRITKSQLVTAMNSLTPSYIQTPPIYSALKHKGTPIYKLARTGEASMEELNSIVKQKSRRVSVYSIELLDFCPPFFTFKATVSKGTYIRSISNDIALNIMLLATTYELNRNRISNFTAQEAVDLKDLKNFQDLKKHIISIEAMKKSGALIC